LYNLEDTLSRITFKQLNKWKLRKVKDNEKKRIETFRLHLKNMTIQNNFRRAKDSKQFI